MSAHAWRKTLKIRTSFPFNFGSFRAGANFGSGGWGFKCRGARQICRQLCIARASVYLICYHFVTTCQKIADLRYLDIVRRSLPECPTLMKGMMSVNEAALDRGSCFELKRPSRAGGLRLFGSYPRPTQNLIHSTPARQG